MQPGFERELLFGKWTNRPGVLHGRRLEDARAMIDS